MNMLTIQSGIYYIMSAVLGTVSVSAFGFFLYWQHSKRMTIDSPKLWGLAYTVLIQFAFLIAAGFLLMEGEAAGKLKAVLLLSSFMAIVAGVSYWMLTLYLPFTHSPASIKPGDRIALKMKDVLKKFSKISGVRAVCLAGRDGFIIDSIVKTDEDAEMISALALDGFRTAEVMGSKLAMGGMSVSMIEYEKGPVMLASVGSDAFLVIVARKDSNLGMIRLAILKHQIRLAVTADV